MAAVETAEKRTAIEEEAGLAAEEGTQGDTIDELRDVSRAGLVRALRVLGYERVRQDGSHVRLTAEVNVT